MLVDHSYGRVDITKIGCTEVCWLHAQLCLVQRCMYRADTCR